MDLDVYNKSQGAFIQSDATYERKVDGRTPSFDLQFLAPKKIARQAVVEG